MKRDYIFFIKDILDAMDKIKEFVGTTEYDEFIKDDMKSSAVVKKIEIIGEAMRNIPRDVRARYRNIPWRNIIGMRNKISHGYFIIDYEIVWKVTKEKLPELKIQVEQMLKEVEKEIE
jgi:uncharacterized protein with HEPN domain